MSRLFTETIHIKGSALNGNSTIPPFVTMNNVQLQDQANCCEEDMHIGYGFVQTLIPYLSQDRYSRETTELSFQSVVLENNFLRAVFLPELGGRLWQLYDKQKKADLLYTNDMFRPCNLALRNAWFSGGVEWNIGMVGHSPFTCSPLHTELCGEDGSGLGPSLRMYEYERIRRVVYQMDFFLPEQSAFLHCRVRLVNPNEETVPMYWWSNVAVPERRKGRVIVPADSAFSNTTKGIEKVPVPIWDGRDISYPVNTAYAKDYFFHVLSSYRYIVYANEAGDGLLQASTSCLKGRKLFVWGQHPGAARWQEFLTDQAGRYCEIQAGLARTQYECVPMPPQSEWEWIELYGAFHAEPQEVQGEYGAARQCVERQLSQLAEYRNLEDLLKTTRETIALRRGQKVLSGSPFGALENRLRAKQGRTLLPAHLTFEEETVSEESAPWLELLETGCVSPQNPDRAPLSYMNQPEWLELLSLAWQQDPDNWWIAYQIGVQYYAGQNWDEAVRCWRKAVERNAAPWARLALAHACQMSQPNGTEAEILAAEAMRQGAEDPDIVRDAWALLLSLGKGEQILSLNQYTELGKTDGRCRFYLAEACYRAGDLQKAEEILLEHGGLVVADLREGEPLTADLWLSIQEAKAVRKGLPFDRDNAQVPSSIDFRMQG